MIIPINDQYRLASNEQAWMIQRAKARTRDGETVTEWPPTLWYVDLPDAVRGLAKLMLRTSDAQTLADALIEVENVATTLTQALAPRFKLIHEAETKGTG